MGQAERRKFSFCWEDKGELRGDLGKNRGSLGKNSYECLVLLFSIVFEP